MYEILDIVYKLNANKSVGYDNLSTKVLKKCICFIVKPLCFIYNLSLSTGCFPSSLKIAKVIPIYKKKVVNRCFQITDLYLFYQHSQRYLNV